MQITLSHAEFGALPVEAQSAILSILKGGPSDLGDSEIPRRDDKRFLPFDLTPLQAKKLLDGVGDTTKKCMKVFTEHNGSASCPQLLKASGHQENRQLGGFQAAINRRLRKLIGDDEIFLFDWDEQRKMFVVSPGTYSSLCEYFKLG